MAKEKLALKGGQEVTEAMISLIKEQKMFLFRAVVVATLIASLMYVFSPFQTCLREDRGVVTCARYTSW
jgi:hypothetical protein